jgi:hypothetical protein
MFQNCWDNQSGSDGHGPTITWGGNRVLENGLAGDGAIMK